MKKRWKVIQWMTWSSFCGLALCNVVGSMFYGGEKQFMQQPWGAALVWTFTGMWIIGLMFLTPISICLDRRQQHDSELSTYSWWEWLLLVPLLRNDRNARVPVWIMYPLLATAFVMMSFLLLILGVLVYKLLMGSL